MKIENIPADIKSKSLKETKEEINKILKNSREITNLEDHIDDYARLLKLNKHVDLLFKKVKRNFTKNKKNVKKKLIKMVS